MAGFQFGSIESRLRLTLETLTKPRLARLNRFQLAIVTPREAFVETQSDFRAKNERGTRELAI